MENLIDDVIHSITDNDAAETVGKELLDIGASIAAPALIVGVFAAGVKKMLEGFEK